MSASVSVKASSVAQATFQTTAETSRLLPGDHGAPPALVINPQASLSVLLATVHSRLDCLLMSLNGWAEAGSNHSAKPAEIVSPALDLAEQMDQLLTEISRRIHQEGARS